MVPNNDQEDDSLPKIGSILDTLFNETELLSNLTARESRVSYDGFDTVSFGKMMQEFDFDNKNFKIIIFYRMKTLEIELKET